MDALADPESGSAEVADEERFPSLTLVEPGLMSLRVSRRTSYWIVSTINQTTRFGVGERHGRDRLLVTEDLDSAQREFLSVLFEDVLSGPRSAFQSMDEMRLAFAAPNFGDLAVGVLVNEERRVVVVIRGNLERIAIPWSWFRPSGTGIAPDFSRVSIEDGGLTIRLGQYEAAMDAILYDYDRDFRARQRQAELDADVSFGASLKRLRIQRGKSRDAFPGLSSKEIARIERGEVAQPHPATLRTIADTLGVSIDELGTY